jgi:hypothetical protein
METTAKGKQVDTSPSDPVPLQLTAPSLEEVLTCLRWDHASARKVSPLFFALRCTLLSVADCRLICEDSAVGI